MKRFKLKNLIFVFTLSLFVIPELIFADILKIAPPIINLVSKDLGNDELWYIGGTASIPKADIVIFLQNNASKETFSFVAKADEQGEWFYAHNDFLKEGQYKSWAQLKIGDSVSPPGPEVSFKIIGSAFRIGKARLSYETVYAAVAIILFLAIIGGLAFFIYHLRFYHRKNSRLRKELFEAEREVRSGFDLLRKDIKEELTSFSKLKNSRNLNIKERQREEKLLSDLDFVENHILKEMGDIEPAI